MTMHFYTTQKADVQKNLRYLRAIQSCVYPRDGDGDVPFYPPPVCRIKCGKLLGDSELCVVLRSYNVKFPTDCAWDSDTMLPYKFDVDMTWEAVYKTTNLPGQERIVSAGN